MLIFNGCVLVRGADSAYIFIMKKRVIDLTAEQADEIAVAAWGDASREALDKGFPVTGSRNGRLIREHPDGRVEDLGPVMSLRDDTKDSAA